MEMNVTLQDSFSARRRISTHVQTTPVQRSETLSDRCKADIFLKLENTQTTGSFKLRGATNAVLSLTDAQRAQGVVGVSTGNHGRGLAFAARQAGVVCTICMSQLVPQNKVEAIRALGADVRIVGKFQDDAEVEVDRLATGGMALLPPFDHLDIIAGQSTVALELVDQVPYLDTVVVPVSGGGLIAGIATVMKAANPSIRIIGVSMQRGAAMYESQRAGHPVLVEELPTLADSLGGGIGLQNRFTFDIVRDLVDDLILVSEAQIADAIRHAYWSERQVVEGSGSVGIAALLAGKIERPGRCAVLLSGQNIDMSLHKRLIDGEDVDLAQTEIKSEE